MYVAFYFLLITDTFQFFVLEFKYLLIVHTLFASLSLMIFPTTLYFTGHILCVPVPHTLYFTTMCNLYENFAQSHLISTV